MQGGLTNSANEFYAINALLNEAGVGYRPQLATVLLHRSIFKVEYVHYDQVVVMDSV